MTLLGKSRHEALKGRLELRRIELTEQPAEGVVAGHPIRKLEKAAQERLLGLREQRHVDRALTTAEHRAQSDHQQFMEIVQTGIAGSRVFQTLPASRKLVQAILPACVSHAAR